MGDSNESKASDEPRWHKVARGSPGPPLCYPFKIKSCWGASGKPAREAIRWCKVRV